MLLVINSITRGIIYPRTTYAMPSNGGATQLEQKNGDGDGTRTLNVEDGIVIGAKS